MTLRKGQAAANTAVCLLSHYEKSRVTVKPKSSQDPAGPEVTGPLLSSLLCSLSCESCRVFSSSSNVPYTLQPQGLCTGCFALAVPFAWNALPPNTRMAPPSFRSRFICHLLSEAQKVTYEPPFSTVSIHLSYSEF